MDETEELRNMAPKQFRIVFSKGLTYGTCFIDAPTEHLARAFFSKTFSNANIEEISLEVVDPCSAYERRK